MSKVLKTIAVVLWCCSLQGCSEFSASVKDFGIEVIGVLPGNQSPVTQKVSESEIDQSEEYWLGRAVAAQLFTVYRPAHRTKINRYIAKVGQSLVRHSARPEIYGGYSFQLVESDEVNALSAPGGFVLITTDLWNLLKNEEELAAILAHEIAHIEGRHGLSAIQDSNRVKGTKIGGTLVSAIDCANCGRLLLAAFQGAVQDVANTLLIKGYSRELEFEADFKAKALLERAGYDVNGFAAVLTTLEALNTKGGGWFHTHPSPKDRRIQLDFSTITPSQQIGDSLRTKRFTEAARG